MLGCFKIGLYESGGWWLPYEGDIDDVRVYSYALTYDQVSQLYFDGSGEPACRADVGVFDVTGPTPGVPDCMVDILDVREFASDWLQCGRYPASECGI